MAIVVLILVNILIAMFTDTYSRVKGSEDWIFKFQKYEILVVSMTNLETVVTRASH